MSIYRSAVKHPVTTTLIFVACAILGLFSLSRISIAQFPEFDANTIMVMSSYPGANARDIESNLTKVLENALNGVADLKELNSQSKENISLLTLTFEYGTDKSLLRPVKTSGVWTYRIFHRSGDFCREQEHPVRKYRHRQSDVYAKGSERVFRSVRTVGCSSGQSQRRYRISS